MEMAIVKMNRLDDLLQGLLFPLIPVVFKDYVLCKLNPAEID